MGFVDPRFQPGLIEQGSDVFGRLALPRTGVVAAVAGVDPDQVAAQRRDLFFGGVGRDCLVLGHTSIVAGVAGAWHPAWRGAMVPTR